MHFQWYPGHMTKAKRMMQEDMKLIDVVIELVDARVPLSSKNPDIDQLANNKYRVILLNKYDLADSAQTEKWKEYFEKQGYFVTMVNSKNGNGIRRVNDIVVTACKEKIERDRKRGILNRPLRAMVVGIPNVGKSTFINSIAGKAATKTGNKPGVTKGKQWIKLNKTIELLDTPGILWPKFEDQSVGLRLAFIGSIKEEILNIYELSIELIAFLSTHYKGCLNGRYGIEEQETAEGNLSAIAEKRACRLKGGELDLNKAAGFVTDDFRNGRLGNITLEFPPEVEETLTKAASELEDKI
ncbi:ribosome biogenesis GTPase A [Anaerocolumna cellulosilytica]|uniref:Ribosome biogenesis GTPase A n=1 Tax=Anaerocolumna cellulosilytica TaxID=433286 RepID=A0A6S6R742_9FIRM|nr:ribosome biogenesis GTPase YlqF [Anaerocolumna cellulosilytica]MBB5198068.1 ribosome biogenesis GTPase A [Anaerocolumna cellulosilytica]BCJ95085.1 ribosome biogenesis GTPase A [Anaerocolumna cellulosilytica]